VRDEILAEFRYERCLGLVVAEAVSAFEGWRVRVCQRSCRGTVRDEIPDEFRYERGMGLVRARGGMRGVRFLSVSICDLPNRGGKLYWFRSGMFDSTNK
jgi:hypothetical protein